MEDDTKTKDQLLSELRELRLQTANLKNSEAELRSLHEMIDAIPNPLFFKDTQGIYLGCNKSFESLLGLRKEQIVGKSVYDISPGHLAEKYYEADMKLLRQPGVQTYESSVVATDGTEHEMIFYKATFRLPDGTLGGLVGTMIDISQRHRLEEALKESEIRLRAIINTAPQCIMLVAHDGTLLEMNPAGLAMIESNSIGEVEGKSFYSVIAPEHRDTFRMLIEKAFKGENGALEFEIIGLKGNHRWLSSHAAPFRDAKSEIIALLGITDDITENRKLRAQLLQSQKMEAVGTLAGGVAHDFNNILTAIIGFGTLAQNRVIDDKKTKECIDEILTGAKRAAELTHNLLAFSRKQTIVLKRENLNDIIMKINKMLVRIIGEDIELKSVLINKELPVLVDAGQIEHILLNLATNARDAMPRGGKLTIETDLVNIDGRHAEAHLFENMGAYAVLRVSDTGIGMDHETKENIFEPFFTTKEVGKGTGLGLAMVYGIVKQHGGNINVHSESGKGTTFMIYLPTVQTPEYKVSGVADPAPVGKGETILVAEDDAHARKITSMYLHEYGYKTIEAENGAEAVSKFKENIETTSLLLLDVIMPVKNGRDAYEEIKKLNPDIKALYMSGYTDDVIARGGILEEGFDFISKPFSPDELMIKIRELLDK